MSRDDNWPGPGRSEPDRAVWQMTSYGLYLPARADHAAGERWQAALEEFTRAMFLVPGPMLAARREPPGEDPRYPGTRPARQPDGDREFLPSLRDIPPGGCKQCRGQGPLTRDGLCAYCDELAFLAQDRTPPWPPPRAELGRLFPARTWWLLSLAAVLVILAAIAMAAA